MFLEIKTYKIDKCHTKTPLKSENNIVIEFSFSLKLTYPGIYTYGFGLHFAIENEQNLAIFDFYELRVGQCSPQDTSLIMTNKLYDYVYSYMFMRFSLVDDHLSFVTPSKPWIKCYLSFTNKS